MKIRTRTAYKVESEFGELVHDIVYQQLGPGVKAFSHVHCFHQILYRFHQDFPKLMISTCYLYTVFHNCNNQSDQWMLLWEVKNLSSCWMHLSWFYRFVLVISVSSCPVASLILRFARREGAALIFFLFSVFYFFNWWFCKGHLVRFLFSNWTGFLNCVNSTYANLPLHFFFVNACVAFLYDLTWWSTVPQ